MPEGGFLLFTAENIFKKKKFITKLSAGDADAGDFVEVGICEKVFLIEGCRKHYARPSGASSFRLISGKTLGCHQILGQTTLSRLWVITHFPACASQGQQGVWERSVATDVTK